MEICKFAARRNMTPLLHSLYTGYELLNESHSGLRYLRTGASMVQRQSIPDIFVAVRFRRTYSRATSLCFVFWPDGATDNSLHHRWTVFPVSSCMHVECSASFCPFVHISVTVQKSTQDRTICAFIPAILLNLSLCHCDSTFLFSDLEVFGFASRKRAPGRTVRHRHLNDVIAKSLASCFFREKRLVREKTIRETSLRLTSFRENDHPGKLLSDKRMCTGGNNLNNFPDNQLTKVRIARPIVWSRIFPLKYL